MLGPRQSNPPAKRQCLFDPDAEKQREIDARISYCLSLPPIVRKRYWCNPNQYDHMNRRCLQCGKTDLEIFTTEPYAREEDIEERERLLNASPCHFNR
jgi:hypothetical protein